MGDTPSDKAFRGKSLSADLTAAPGSVDPQDRTALLDNLYRQHWRELCNFLKNRYGAGPPEPEDVAQTTFAKVAELKNLGDIQNPRAFLFRTAKNIFIDQVRRNSTRDKYATEEQTLADSLDDGEGSAVFEVERVLIHEEEAFMLKNALQSLDKRERDFLLLHRLHGLSYTDIARRTGMSRNGVKAVIKKAFAQCEAAMEQASQQSGKGYPS